MFNMFNRKNKKTALPPEVVAIDTELAGIEPQIQDAVRAEDFALAQQLKNRSVELTASREEAVEAFRQVEALHAKQEAEKVQAAELARRGRKASRKARSSHGVRRAGNPVFAFIFAPLKFRHIFFSRNPYLGRILHGGKLHRKL